MNILQTRTKTAYLTLYYSFYSQDSDFSADLFKEIHNVVDVEFTRNFVVFRHQSGGISAVDASKIKFIEIRESDE